MRSMLPLPHRKSKNIRLKKIFKRISVLFVMVMLRHSLNLHCVISTLMVFLKILTKRCVSSSSQHHKVMQKHNSRLVLATKMVLVSKPISKKLNVTLSWPLINNMKVPKQNTTKFLPNWKKSDVLKKKSSVSKKKSDVLKKKSSVLKKKSSVLKKKNGFLKKKSDVLNKKQIALLNIVRKTTIQVWIRLSPTMMTTNGLWLGGLRVLDSLSMSTTLMKLDLMKKICSCTILMMKFWLKWEYQSWGIVVS
mmetsp:Transcript_21714/g.32228  ORF Transcript_21714/g.32228 Transcript_21714/m.32228 type:complete len:249 (-) Transcript_21714:97-843(-)